MSSLRSLLLHLDASPRSAVRLALARDVAARHDATVTALFGVAPTLLDVSLASADGPAGVALLFEQLSAKRRDDARRLFDRPDFAATPPMIWRELSGQPLVAGVTRHALCSDLLVLGQHDGDDLQALGVPSDFVASVLVASGKPALVVPYAGAFATLGRAVLIAWKPTREAARAVSAALPLLGQAQSIHITAELDPDAQAGGTSDLEAYLRLHGVAARIERHAAIPADAAGDMLLSLAAYVGADLLVMGCYGHSRARELVLGGASRTVLKSMTVPVLMAH